MLVKQISSISQVSGKTTAVQGFGSFKIPLPKKMTMKIIQFFLGALLCATLLPACIKDGFDPEKQHTDDVKAIQNYLSDKNLNAQSTASGLHYIIEVEGQDGHPSLQDSVEVTYKGYYLDGTVFDESKNGPIVFKLSRVIAGWQEGIQLFKKGGQGKLFLPSNLAYGPNPPPGVRANAVMAFDVTLLDFWQ